jgi:hypothetical protein
MKACADASACGLMCGIWKAIRAWLTRVKWLNFGGLPWMDLTLDAHYNHHTSVTDWRRSIVIWHLNDENFAKGNGMPLIEKIFAATQSNVLRQPFTVDHLKDWMRQMRIVKDDGSLYAQSSIDAILSNSDTKNIPTTNNNRKVLQSHINTGGKYEYWF